MRQRGTAVSPLLADARMSAAPEGAAALPRVLSLCVLERPEPREAAPAPLEAPCTDPDPAPLPHCVDQVDGSGRSQNASVHVSPNAASSRRVNQPVHHRACHGGRRAHRLNQSPPDQHRVPSQLLPARRLGDGRLERMATCPPTSAIADPARAASLLAAIAVSSQSGTSPGFPAAASPNSLNSRRRRAQDAVKRLRDVRTLRLSPPAGGTNATTWLRARSCSARFQRPLPAG